MHLTLMKSKIHRATVTRAELHYEGSCSIDAELMREADIRVGEQVHIVNVSNGSRAVTYAIEGGPGEIALNGAMAHIGGAGDVVCRSEPSHASPTSVRSSQRLRRHCTQRYRCWR